jgi:hypothetical protein
MPRHTHHTLSRLPRFIWRGAPLQTVAFCQGSNSQQLGLVIGALAKSGWAGLVCDLLSGPAPHEAPFWWAADLDQCQPAPLAPQLGALNGAEEETALAGSVPQIRRLEFPLPPDYLIVQLGLSTGWPNLA